MNTEELKYPIGKFNPLQELNKQNRKKWMKTIRRFPKNLRAVIRNLNNSQLDTPYRPGGWTLRQVIHHLADSHLNSYIRFKWALTEETPLIKTYHQVKWAELPDAKSSPINPSIRTLRGIHKRWSILMNAMTEEDFRRELTHPEWKDNLSLNRMLSLYAWHCDHHLAHITSLMTRNGWSKQKKGISDKAN